ncbi:MAG: thioredoxin [Rickettsiales endosymbiont of Dermacentor nuttalli]
MVLEINDQNFEFETEVLKSDLPVVVDFWAPWCSPCLQLAPTLEAVAQELKGKIKIVKMNIDENTKTPSQLGVKGIPTLILFKQGKLTSTRVGSLAKESLLQWIKDNI